jgi:hypothetical protein
VAIACFVVSVGAAVLVLVPREDLTFSVRGTSLFEGLADSRDHGEAILRAATILDRMWATNELTIRSLSRAFSVAATGLAIEVVSLAALLGGTLL